jgi:hypothetical protein
MLSDYNGGAGGPGLKRDIGIRDGRIADVSATPLSPESATRVIDARLINGRIAHERMSGFAEDFGKARGYGRWLDARPPPRACSR